MPGLPRIAPRRYLAWVLLATALVAALSLSHGAAALSLAEVMKALGAGLGLCEADPMQATIVNVVRLPRVLVAILAGASLAIAGTVMQALFRNPLASPEIMGTAAGSALGAVVAIALGLAGASVLAVPAFAFLGALLVSFIVFLAASSAGGVSVVGLLLAGIAMNSLVGAATAFFVSLFFPTFERSGAILFWLMGGLEHVGMASVMIVGAGLLVCTASLIPFLRDMDLLTLREETAASLGVNVKRLRIALLTVACGITATAVSCTGGIVFVGLVVPHMVRLVVGPAHRALVPCAGATGALVLVLSDLLVKLAPVDSNLRLGVVTSVLGAPFFFYLLLRHRRGYLL